MVDTRIKNLPNRLKFKLVITTSKIMPTDELFDLLTKRFIVQKLISQLDWERNKQNL